jgi:Cu/Ag efflux protein CusF
MTRLRFLILTLSFAFAACSSHKVTSTLTKRYAIEGDVLRMNQADQTATVKHGEIKGWMGPMTMDYQVPSKADYALLHPGDHFKATVFVQDEEFWLGDIQASGPKTQEQSKPEPPK